MTARDLLHRLGLYRPAARLADDLLRTPRAQHRRQLLALYRPLIAAGDLVFDIGAHDGTYAEVFAALGARVVSAEPNPDSARRMRMRTPASVTVIETAIGAKDGTATLHVPSDQKGYSALGTLSDSWIAVATNAPRFQGRRWDRELTVPVTTLDALRARYGEPAYIKIDVEGYEEEVLNGLTRQPSLLSVEFNAEALPALVRCLDHRVIAPGSRFNYVIGAGGGLSLGSWIDRRELNQHLPMLARQVYGDVLVRRPSQ